MKSATAEPTPGRHSERTVPFTTISGRPIERLYTPGDVSDLDYAREVADPGDFYPPDGPPRQGVDDAAVCRVRNAG
jgi:hypothetical protein